ncbi:MAG: helix-turn-helix transcriptional regulator [Alphaproteobacteria bacterium]
MDVMQQAARNIRLFRNEAGLSQEALAHHCGVHRTYISMVERCQRNFSVKTLGKIAKALDVPAWKLLHDDPRALK